MRVDNNQYGQSRIAFNGGLKSLNVINPISHYVDRYFVRSANISQTKFDEFVPSLKSSAKLVKFANKNVQISALDINPDNSTKYVLFLHGMAQNVNDYQRLYNEIISKKVGVFALEYRGYGRNPKAKITEDRLRKDVARAYEYLLTEKSITPQNIVVMGHSMGGALAVDFASKHKELNSLVLLAPISNLGELGEKFTLNKNLGIGAPGVISKLTKRSRILSWLYKKRFNSIDKIGKVKVPTYIIQSKNDSVTPLAGTRKLVKNARKAKILSYFKILPSGGHKVDFAKISSVSEILEMLSFG